MNFHRLLKSVNPLSANPTKWSNTLNCLSVFDHFVGLALKGLRQWDFPITGNSAMSGMLMKI